MFAGAQRFGHTAVVSLLLEAGADWQHKDCTGRTALEWAKEGEENDYGTDDAAAVLGAWAASVELQDEMARHSPAATITSTSAILAGAVVVADQPTGDDPRSKRTA